jgi:hypothetical protein
MTVVGEELATSSRKLPKWRESSRCLKAANGLLIGFRCRAEPGSRAGPKRDNSGPRHVTRQVVLRSEKQLGVHDCRMT